MIANDCFMWNRIMDYVKQRSGEKVNFFINIDIREGF